MPHECTNCGKVFPDGSKEMLSGCPDCGGNKFQFRPSGASGSGGDARTAGDRTGTAGGSTDAPTETEPDRRSEASNADTDESPRSSNRSEASDAGATESPTWQRTAERADETEPRADESPPRTTPTDAGTDSRDDADSSEPTRDDGPRGLSGRAADAGRTVRDWVNGNSSTDAAGETSDADTQSDTRSAHADATSETTDSTASADSPSREDSAQASARADVVSPDEIEAAASRAAVDDADGPPTDVDGTVIEPDDDDRPDLAELREELNNQFESIKIVRPGEYELNLMELYDRNEYIISLREDGRYVIEVPDAWGDRGPDEE
jgi:hypothetical protein